MVNKIVLGVCIGFSCSMVFSEDHILWDFGVVIKSAEYHNISSKYGAVSP